MLIDISERHPKGPEALLRGHHYQKRSDAGYYDRHETELNAEVLLAKKKTEHIVDTCTVKDFGFCAESYGYPVMALREFYKKHNRMSDHYNFRNAVESFLIGRRSEGLSEAEKAVELEFLGYRKQATQTRRAKRIHERKRRMRRWIESNVTTAYYRFETGYYSNGSVYVHADSEHAAKTQFDLFLKPAFDAIQEAGGRTQEQNYYARYDSPAIEGPIGLMTKNDSYVKKVEEEIHNLYASIDKMQKKIEAYKAAQQLVHQYTINMTCSYAYEDEE